MKTISIDTGAVRGNLDKGYLTCVSASRAYLLLRADHMAHLKTVHDECGFSYVRFHGLLQDDLGIYRIDKSGQPIYSWQYCDAVYDHILDIGMRPFVVFDFMPEVLASGDKTIYWERSNITKPASYEEWYNLIFRITAHFTERYGEDEVKQWYFEVWNEPDGWFFDGSQEDYFRLYETAARAVKAVCSDYRIGGPSVAGAYDWLPALADYCREHGVSLDFFSAHTYALTEFAAGQKSTADAHIPTWKPGTPWGLSNLKLSPDMVPDAVRRCTALLAEKGLSDIPVHFTEWGLTYCYWDPLHDSYRAPSHMLRALKQSIHHVASMSFCEVSDVFEEDGPPTDHFHGGFGLLNLQGIRKPSFFAYRFLHMLGDQELVCEDDDTIVCQNACGYQILTWNPTYRQNTENIHYYGCDNPPQESEERIFRLKNVKNGSYTVRQYRVGYMANDAHTAFLQMTRKESLSRAEVDALKTLADGSPEQTFPVEIEDGQFEYSTVLRDNDVLLLTLTSEPSHTSRKR